MQVGSALAYRGIPLQTAYCGAKHAIQGFHEALRCELLHEHSGVHVTMVQMPAVNTPQFSWVLSRLPAKAQPVPPIYQPEVAARAVAVRRGPPRRREYWVGGGTVAPWSPTRWRRGCSTATWPGPASPRQQTDEPQRPGPAGQPVGAGDAGRRDYGTHGLFDDRSTAPQPELWASQHHGLLAVLAGGAAAGTAAVARAVRR